MENWSFDSLYGTLPGANGIDNAANAAPQVDKTGKVYDTLPVPLNSNQRDSNGKAQPDPRFPATLPNKPFLMNQFAPTSDLIGDMVHRYYQEQYQIDGGKMDKFVAWTDAAGLVMGYYDTTNLPMCKLAKQYTLGDNFFHAAFGGSFLNAFWLVCACTPTWPNAPADIVSSRWMRTGTDDQGRSGHAGRLCRQHVVSVYMPHPATVKPDHLVAAARRCPPSATD